MIIFPFTVHKPLFRTGSSNTSLLWHLRTRGILYGRGQCVGEATFIGKLLIELIGREDAAELVKAKLDGYVKSEFRVYAKPVGADTWTPENRRKKSSRAG